MRILISLLFSLFFVISCEAQTSEKTIDTVYAENISTVIFTKTGLPMTLPIIDVKNRTNVTVSFDDMDGDVKRYVYQVELCNRDWTPTTLEYNEYAEGFPESKIITYKPGYNTLLPFMHYTLTLPNQDVRFIKSGNYLLKVYEDGSKKKAVLTRRFMIVEPTLGVSPTLSTASGSKYNTHQEFSFNVLAKNFNVGNPMLEISASVLQNNRWDVAKINVTPKYIQGDNIVFDDRDVLSFQAGKEFRFLDLRSYRIRTERIKKIERGAETWEAYLYPDVDRSGQVYIKYKDINGAFLILTNDETEEPDLRSEYMQTHFALLRHDSIEDASVYLVGKFTDWQLKEEYKMNYHEVKQGGFYEVSTLLKQGVYNYQYVVKNKKDTQPDFAALEGDWYEAENEYTIFVYYRPFGARYDRIIGVTTFSSAQL